MHIKTLIVLAMLALTGCDPYPCCKPGVHLETHEYSEWSPNNANGQQFKVCTNCGMARARSVQLESFP